MSDSCSDESDEFDSCGSSKRSGDDALSTLGAPARGPLLFCYAGLAVPVRLGLYLVRAEGPYYNVRSLVMQVAQQSPRYNPSALDAAGPSIRCDFPRIVSLGVARRASSRAYRRWASY